MSTADVTTAFAVDAAVVRLVQALQVLKEAPPDLLVQHANALNMAQSTIDALVIVVAHTRTLGDIYH
jgi:hypothetical protein